MYLQQTQRHLSSKVLSSSRLLVQQQQLQQKRRATNRGQPAQILAMINVDGSPPLFLGAGMIAAGAILYQLRNSRPYITKDFDIVLSCIAIFAGGILVFQVTGHPSATPSPILTILWAYKLSSYLQHAGLAIGSHSSLWPAVDSGCSPQFCSRGIAPQGGSSQERGEPNLQLS